MEYYHLLANTIELKMTAALSEDGDFDLNIDNLIYNITLRIERLVENKKVLRNEKDKFNELTRVYEDLAFQTQMYEGLQERGIL